MPRQHLKTTSTTGRTARSPRVAGPLTPARAAALAACLASAACMASPAVAAPSSATQQAGSAGPTRPLEDAHADDVVRAHDATVKICKVAGPGIAIGRKFTFKIAGATYVVRAGPAPDGSCAVVGTYPAGLPLTVREVPLPATSLVGVTVAPAQALTTNVMTRTVVLTPHPGVNVLTFVNSHGAAGYLEICKAFRGDKPGDRPYDFDVAGRPVSVAAGSCSPPILVPAGPTKVTEHKRPGTVLAGCSTQPDPAALLSCKLRTRTATVGVKPGDVSRETIVTFTNRPRRPRLGTLEVCKIAGVNTPIGIGFPIDIKGTDGAITRIYVPAGQAPKGTCVTIGAYPIGTKLNVADQQSYYYLWDETGHGAGSTPGTVFHPEINYGNPANYDVVIGRGKTTVYFTNDCPWPGSKPCL